MQQTYKHQNQIQQNMIKLETTKYSLFRDDITSELMILGVPEYNCGQVV